MELQNKHTITTDLLLLIASWKNKVKAPSNIERKIYKEVIKNLLRIIEKNNKT